MIFPQKSFNALILLIIFGIALWLQRICLALGNENKKLVFLSHFTRFSYLCSHERQKGKNIKI